MSASLEVSGADAGTGLMLPSEGETMEVAADAAALGRRPAPGARQLKACR